MKTFQRAGFAALVVALVAVFGSIDKAAFVTRVFTKLSNIDVKSR